MKYGSTISKRTQKVRLLAPPPKCPEYKKDEKFSSFRRHFPAALNRSVSCRKWLISERFVSSHSLWWENTDSWHSETFSLGSRWCFGLVRWKIKWLLYKRVQYAWRAAWGLERERERWLSSFLFLSCYRCLFGATPDRTGLSKSISHSSFYVYTL